MAEHGADILWERGEHEDFLKQRYSRRHSIRFDGGAVIAGSSSPHVVPLPLSVAAAVDPEEAFIAALSSCHMLFFLSFAARDGFIVEDYRDEAVGIMARNDGGKLSMTRVTLHPRVRYGDGKRPTRAEEDALHHASHEECFIASSVRTEVACEPVRTPD